MVVSGASVCDNDGCRSENRDSGGGSDSDDGGGSGVCRGWLVPGATKVN